MLLLATGVGAENPPRFQFGSVFQQDISAAPVHPQSASMIATNMAICSGDVSGCGFGFGRMHIDFSIEVMHAAPGVPTRPVAQHAIYQDYYSPDCDPIGTQVPLPPGGRIEGSTNYACDNENNDCHLIVVQGSRLYELYSANVGPDVATATQIDALCLATWQLDAIYPDTLRGEHCTSADAAGFPIAPLLFNPDEIRQALTRSNPADQHLDHALRFIMPNDRMASLPDGPDSGTLRDRVYVRPATHAGGPDGPTGAIPYGSRLRLRADFDMTGYSASARVILRTMQKYGIVLADGGNIALTAQADTFTTAKWTDTDIAISSRVFDQTPGAIDVNLNHFDVLDTTPQILETYECEPNTISSVLFADSFE
jgi:serine/threonine-protein kinase